MRQRNRVDDAGRRKRADSLRIVVQLESRLASVNASRKRRRRRQTKQNSSLAARVASFVLIVNAARDVEERKTAAVNDAIISCAARKLRPRTEQAETAALAEHAAVKWTATFIRYDVHHTANGV